MQSTNAEKTTKPRLEDREDDEDHVGSHVHKVEDLSGHKHKFTKEKRATNRASRILKTMKTALAAMSTKLKTCLGTNSKPRRQNKRRTAPGGS